MGFSPNDVSRRVDGVIEMLGIGHLRERPPFRLSGGEKKKVAVASVLVLSPEVLILDEPTGGLDPKSQRWLEDLLLTLKRQGRTILIATHNLDLAHLIADRALVLDEEHRLVYDGPAAEALDNHRLLASVNLIGEYTHEHGRGEHRHQRVHN
jgi:cobalt/nickel transport system ATP-binding protein